MGDIYVPSSGNDVYVFETVAVRSSRSVKDRNGNELPSGTVISEIIIFDPQKRHIITCPFVNQPRISWYDVRLEETLLTVDHKDSIVSYIYQLEDSDKIAQFFREKGCEVIVNPYTTKGVVYGIHHTHSGMNTLFVQLFNTTSDKVVFNCSWQMQKLINEDHPFLMNTDLLDIPRYADAYFDFQNVEYIQTPYNRHLPHFTEDSPMCLSNLTRGLVKAIDVNKPITFKACFYNSSVRDTIKQTL